MNNQFENGYQEFLDFLAAEKNASASTITSYKTDFGIFMHFLVLTGTEPTFHTVGTPLIRRYISYLKQDKKFATSTLRRKIHSLSSFFKFLLEQEYIEKNPMLSIHAPKKEQKLPIYLKENEIKRLVEAPREYARFDSHQLRDKVMIELLVYTGARKSEVLALDWDDIDFGKKTILIRNGKGKKQRIIPLIEPLYADLWEYLQSRLPLSNRAVLLSDKGNRLSTSNFQVLFRRYLNKAMLDGKGYTIHKCRHSFASLLHQAGVDIISIQELLGHADLNSTKIYTHTDVKHLQQQVEKFPVRL